MVLTNKVIYATVQAFDKYFQSLEQYLPAHVTYAILKNYNILQVQFNIIEETRNTIIKRYGKETENGYIVPEENIAKANQELNTILSLEQDVPILMIKMTDLQGLNFTLQQMQALLFMIEED